MTGKKSFVMLLSVLLLSLGIMIFIGGTEPHTGYISTSGSEFDADLPSEETPIETQPLTVNVSVGAVEFARLLEWNERFMEEHAGLKVDVQHVAPPDEYDWLSRQLKTGQAADIVLAANEWIGEWATNGLLLNVDEFFKGDEQARHFPQLIRQMSWNGYIWGVPKEVDPYILVWNESALREAGWSYPPRTRENLLELEQVFREQGRVGLYVDVKDPYALASYWSVMQNESVPAWDELLNQESFAETQEGADEVEEKEKEKRATWSLLNEGRIAMMIAPYSDYSRFRTEHLHIMPVNGLDSFSVEPQASGWLKGKSFAIPAGSDKKSAALEWIRFMTQEAVQLELMASGSGLPANIDAYRSDVFRNLPQREALLQAIEQGAAFPLHPDLPLALRQHALDLDKLMNGEWTEEAELLFRRHPVKPADVAANALNSSSD
jgi:ABC-type glycerol-3-phosphate transport system substrate-binding protein